MNTSKIKNYAIQARRDFIKAVTERANFYGIFGGSKIEPMDFKGDVAIIGGRAFSKKEGELREKLANRIQRDGFERVMRASAYTWFNRLVALRYMELHDYLEHGYRVLSHPSGSDTPEILEHVLDIEFQGINKEKVIELRLAGDKDNELYRLLIIAQCNALHRFMPFLFDKIDSETELLLPDNLLHSDSPVRKMVNETDESDWKDVEIIGWIYQFYISERKDQVIGKVVKSEDIPAATQLFTPNWIVKYMVQNTLGRMWLATYPDSPLRNRMEYYIEPAGQEPEVRKQIDAVTPKSLNPEEITFLDPACGSGHILVEAYDILKEIYQERGYRTKDIPRLILEKNLYGLDIDDRAAQLAGFAVMMRAKRDDHCIISRNDLKLNILSIQETRGFNAEDIANKLAREKVVRFTGDDQLFPDFKGQMALKSIDRPEVSQEDIIALLELFQQGKTFGSLISIPEKLTAKLPLIASLIESKLKKGDIFEREAADKLQHVLQQAIILGRKYDCVVTNPPYMGVKFFNLELKAFVNKNFENGKVDLFACFMLRNMTFCKSCRFIGMITIPNWMFLSTFEKFRNILLHRCFFIDFLHIGRGVWGSDFGSCSFTLCNSSINSYKGKFKRLFEKQGSVAHNNDLLMRFFQNKPYYSTIKDFERIPGNPIAYWASQNMRAAFASPLTLDNSFKPRKGIDTGNNDLFLRFWHEVNLCSIGFGCKSESESIKLQKVWYPYNKGGEYRKWYGNFHYIVDWKNGGEKIRNYKDEKGKVRSNLRNQSFFFKRGVTWTDISSSCFGARLLPYGFICDNSGSACYGNDELLPIVLCLLTSKVSFDFLKILNPTLHFQAGNLSSLPLPAKTTLPNFNIFDLSVEYAKTDWDSYEISWDFALLPILNFKFLKSVFHTEKNNNTLLNQKTASGNYKISKTYAQLRTRWLEITLEMQRIEEKNNLIFIKAYGLQDELTPDVPLSEITLTCNPHYRYGGGRPEDELEALLKTDTIKELLSYAIGCMMGRYSLDQPGLIYAHSGNIEFDPSKYKAFPVDEDGIIPIMDQDWFPDDVANRFVEFLKVAWKPETLEENLKFVAESLNQKKNNDAPIDTIRRYLSTGFFKDHLKTYKKRPIYWLFSSGKQKAFECLVYLHRYNESTLSRMRSSYVTPLQGKFSARLEFLQNEKNAATTASAQRKIQKQIDVLKKKQAELSAFDDELRHYADMKISLDLDDGVKVNYGKFGNLLAEVKTITGKIENS